MCSRPPVAANDERDNGTKARGPRIAAVRAMNRAWMATRNMPCGHADRNWCARIGKALKGATPCRWLLMLAYCQICGVMIDARPHDHTLLECPLYGRLGATGFGLLLPDYNENRAINPISILQLGRNEFSALQ